jgi:glycosyltransferase involved in cell wall biosynthesis
MIHDVDREFIARARGCYAESLNVQHRLQHYCGLQSKVLYHPPPDADRLYRGPYGDYLLVPGRINETKRQALVVEALANVRSAARVVMMWRPDRSEYGDMLRAKAVSFGSQVTWTGYVSEEERLRLFAEARGVLFPPLDEDYGYGTLEAMLSGKAVLTCTDCGGALEFVANGDTGLISDPTPAGMAEMIDRFWLDPCFARTAGEAGYERYRSLNISWDNVVSCLLD